MSYIMMVDPMDAKPTQTTLKLVTLVVTVVVFKTGQPHNICTSTCSPHNNGISIP